jgi:hypothetical protein
MEYDGSETKAHYRILSDIPCKARPLRPKTW